MPSARRFTTKQIVAKLREAEKVRGGAIVQLCKPLQMTDRTFDP